MGNQQLIILVIGVVIVGIATVVAIDAWDSNRTQAAADALSQDLAKIAADAQAWKQKPQPFGGQPIGGANGCAPDATTGICAETDWTGMTDANGGLTLLGYQVDPLTNIFRNLNGRYQLTTDGGAAASPVFTGYNDQFDVEVQLTVNGLQSDDITSAVIIDGAGSAPF